MNVYLIEESRHFFDYRCSYRDVDWAINIDHGVFADRATAESKADELNQALRDRYIREEEKRRSQVHAEAREVRRHNDDKDVLRSAGRQVEPDELVPVFTQKSYEDWLKTQDDYSTYKVVEVNVM